MEVARGDANRAYGPFRSRVLSACPRAGPTGVPFVLAAVLLKKNEALTGAPYAAAGPSTTNGRLSRHTRHTMRTNRFAIAAVAMLDPRRAATVRAQVRKGDGLVGCRLCESVPRAACTNKVRRY